MAKKFTLSWHPRDNSGVYYRPECWPLPDPHDRVRFMAAIRATPMHAEVIRGSKQLNDAELAAEVHNAWRRLHSGDVEAFEMGCEARIAKKLERFATNPHAIPFPNVEVYE